MSEYGMCECFACYRRVSKPEAHRITIEREKGHTSGSARFSRRSASYYTGRTYYAKQDVWLCNTCYAAYTARRQRDATRQKVIGAVLVFGLAIYGLGMTLNPSDQGKQATQAADSQPANQTADVVHVDDVAKQTVPSSKETLGIQNRLIELGYLIGTADGVWGPKSRTALRGFKVANGLAADDKWDEPTRKRLFSTTAAWAPAPTAAAR